MTNGPGEAGVIHDIGYRHYDGPRLGRGYLLLSLYLDSLRGAFGLGRAARSKVMPFLLVAVLLVPALVMAAITTLTGADELPVDYRSYAIGLQTPISVFLAAQAPVLVSRDLRYKVMPLYFSRPLTRPDYVLGKLAAMTSALFVLAALPLVVLYAGALLAKLPFWAQTRAFGQGLVGVALLAVVLASIGLLIASITPRRGFGVAAVIVVMLVAAVTSGILSELAKEQGNPDLAGYLGGINPVLLVDGVQVWLLNAEPFDGTGPPGTTGGIVFALLTVALVGVCYLGLRLRYRRVAAS